MMLSFLKTPERCLVIDKMSTRRSQRGSNSLSEILRAESRGTLGTTRLRERYLVGPYQIGDRAGGGLSFGGFLQ